jgi:hypothetical protein
VTRGFVVMGGAIRYDSSRKKTVKKKFQLEAKLKVEQ